MSGILKFCLPFALWVFLLRDFVFGVIPVNMDTHTIYGVTKYYFNNLLNGVVPLWEPFVDLGRPFYALSICNLFNPVTQLVAVLKLSGVNYYAGFLTYLAAYFVLGLAGFYLLAREIFKDRACAFWAYVLLLFSGLGLSIFTQLTWLEIFVPAVWFSYFCLRFAARPTPGNFLGLCLSLMIVLTSYLPFYFLTLAGVCLIGAFIFYFSGTVRFVTDAFRFLNGNRALAAVGLAGILVAAAPLGAYKMVDASNDIVSPGRHCQYSSAQECYERTMNQKGGMLYEEVTRSGTLGERVDFGFLFTHLDKLTYGSDSPLFIPIFVFLLIWLGAFLRLSRPSALILTVAAVIALIALGDVTPVYRFLYDHVFFFKYFRNLFFFCAFLIPLAVLFAVGQMKALLELRLGTTARRKAAIIGILVLHALFAAFLLRYDGVITTTFVTVIVSAVLFALYYGGVRWKTPVWAALFAAAMCAQPAQVMVSYAANAAEFKCVLPHDHVVPLFGWVRPDKAQTSECRIYQFVHYEDFWYAMSMTDAPARVGYPQAASRWVFDLSQKTDEATLANYGRYKIVVYDDAEQPAIPVTGDSTALRVKHFDVNQLVLATDLPRRMMLVYNDAFTGGWKVFIDTKPAELLRANSAFKGVWVEPGAHTVAFRYSPWGGQGLYIFVTVVLMAFAVVTVLVLRKEEV